MSQRLLVPLEGSTLTELALKEALSLAQLPDSMVLVLRVIPPIVDVSWVPRLSPWISSRGAEQAVRVIT